MNGRKLFILTESVDKIWSLNNLIADILDSVEKIRWLDGVEFGFRRFQWIILWKSKISLINSVEHCTEHFIIYKRSIVVNQDSNFYVQVVILCKWQRKFTC
jgi:hypothetical protein